MDNIEKWFENFNKSMQFELLSKRPIAYFSVEYALSPKLPTYAGGLGVLAGDYVRELGDRGIPAVAVGLYYQNKYGVLDKPHVRSNGDITNPRDQGLIPVLDANGKSVTVEVPIEDHVVYAKAWIWQQDSIPVYLLDTDVEENSHADREIGYQLYDSDKETRLKQEMVLGIGGYRLLEKLQIQPSIYHMNEGHSAMLYLEIIRHEMEKRKIGFNDAMQLSTHHVVFTNHTLVASGNEIFRNDLISFLLARYAGEIEVPISDILALGTIEDSNSFSMSLLSLKLAGKINAVSSVHAREAAKSWTNYEIEYVTNGIHMKTWDKVGETLASDNRENNLFEKHKENKRELIKYLNMNKRSEWSENDLIIGWARRMVPYKRPMSMLGDIERFRKLTTEKNRPVRIIMGGVAHQSDDEGREMIKSIKGIIEEKLSDTAIFLDDYSVTLSKLLVSGCDLWLNTPVIGSEACGTSGMKAALNGTLVFSTSDGWVDEVNTAEIGWDINSEGVEESILDVLEYDILPLFYSEDLSKWYARMKVARNTIKERFLTTRMLKEYLEKLYIPIIDVSLSHYDS